MFVPINKVLLEPSYVCSSTDCLWWCLSYKGRAGWCQRLDGPQSWRNTIWLFSEKFAAPFAASAFCFTLCPLRAGLHLTFGCALKTLEC